MLCAVAGVRSLEETGLQAEHPEHDEAVVSVVLAGRGNANVVGLLEHLKELGREMGPLLYRIKGVLARAGSDRKVILQGVHGSLEATDHAHSRWPPEGSKATSGERICQVVLIGKDIGRRRAALEASCSAAAELPLRAVSAKLQGGPDAHAPPHIALMFWLLLAVIGVLVALQPRGGHSGTVAAR